MTWSIAAVLAFVVFTGTAEAQSPIISSITPGTALPAGGAGVTLFGAFIPPIVTVSFGSNDAAILASSQTTITVTSPTTTHSIVSVTVTDANGTSDGFPFTFGEPGNLEIVSAKDRSRSDAPGTGDGPVFNAYPAVSADGRYVAFLSSATDLAPNQSSTGTQVFLRDRRSGTTQLLSGASGSASPVSISADGRSVVCTSLSTPSQVCLYRRSEDGTITFTLVSHQALSLDTGSTSNASSPMISRDGSTVVFSALGTDLVFPYTAGSSSQGYRYDVASGLITLATPKNGTVASATGINAAATLSAISDDGRWIGFTSNATNALSSNTAAGSKFFLFDAVNGTTRLLNRQYGTLATKANGNAGSGGGSSSDGQYTAFVSGGDLVSGQSGTGAVNNIYLYDRVADTVTLISHSASDLTVGASSASALGNTSLGRPVISSDGRFVVFSSTATNLLGDFSGGGGGTGGLQYYLYDRLGNGGAGSVTLITHTSNGASIGSFGGVSLNSASVSSDGSRVVFASVAADLVFGLTDSNASANIYTYTTATGALTFVSGTAVDREAGSTVADSFKPVVSADGTFIAFVSGASDLAANDTNFFSNDLFGYTGFQVGAPTLISGNTAAYTEAGSATALDSNLAISNLGSSTLASATISISAGFLAGDTLNFVDQNGITASYNSATGVLTLTGSASRANYQAALRSITFSSTSHDPTNFGANLSRTIAWVVYDGTTDSSTVTSTVNITAVNDAPTFVGATTTLDLNQDASATSIVSNLHASDPDGSQTLTWSQNSAPSHGSLSFSNATASTPGADITPGGTITYTPTSGYAGSDSFVVQVGDGTATATRSITVTVNPPFIYTTSDNTISITGYNTIPADGVVVIPDTIDGNPVASIADHAFDNCASLTSVTIPDSVTSIGESAFDDCSGLTNVTMGSGVTSIGNYAFVRCTGLTSVIIPNSVVSIGESAFDDCSGLANVTIGNGVTNIGNYAFVRCTGLTSIIIPDSVTSIGISAFEDCSSLTSVTFGSNVTSIGDYAFVRCTSLTSAILPDNVTSIGANAFADCTSLIGPVADSVDVPVNGTYGAGQNFDFTLHYLENTFVTGTPSIGLTVGSTVRAANYISGNGTHHLRFCYTIQAGESDTNGIVSPSIVTLNGGTIQNLAGVNAALIFSASSTSGVLVDTLAPQIMSIVRQTPTTQIMRSNPVVFAVTFSEAVTNVGTSSFVIVPVDGGTTTATVASVTGGPSVYEVTANITGGAGDFRLDVGPVVTTFTTGFGNSSALAFDQAGNLYVADEGNNTIKKVTGGVVSTFASGFSSPYGMVFSPAGDLYVASYNQVKKVTSGGVVSTFATGFNVACGLAMGSDGNLYVGNFGNDTVSKVTGGGVVSTFATNINAPIGLTFDVAGNLYVASRDASVISKITPGGVVTTFATGLAGPEQLQFDAAGDLFVADRWADRIVRVKPDGTVSTYAANMPRAYGLVFDAAGALYVSSYYSDNTVRKLTLPVISDLASNVVPGLPYNLGETYTYDPNDAPTDIQLSNASATAPAGVGATIGMLSTTDADGADTHTYSLVSGADDAHNGLFSINGNALQIGASPLAADYYSVRVQTNDGQGGTYAEAFVIAVGVPQITSIVRKTPSAQVTGANTLVFEVAFSEPVTAVGTGAFAVTPINGSTVTGTVISVSGGPSVYTVAVGLTGGTGDFRLDAVLQSPVASTFASGFSSPSALAFDGAGNLFVANNGANTVSKVTSGGEVSLFASGFSGPIGLAFDGLGNLYVANRWSGAVNTVTGGGSVSVFADGFQQPNGLAFDSAGNLYVSTGQNNSVSKVTSGGAVSGFASGFNGPTAMAFDATGDLYVGNQWNNSVSKVTSDGNGSFYTDGFNGAAGLAFDGAGNLYVANNWNNTVSKVTRAKVVSTFAAGINAPTGLSFDSAGDLFVASQSNGTITRLASASIKDLTGTEMSGLPFTSGETYTIVPNATPTDIALSNSSVNQSGGVNATVGTLTTTDADGADTHTYALVSGTGGTDNTPFNLSGSTLRANNATALAAGNYSVHIETNDGNGGTFQKIFVLTVVDDIAPNAPTAFTAVAIGGTITLGWANPVSDFASCTIRRSTSAFPTTVSAGTAVASGLTGTSYSDAGLADGTYYYAIFALDAAGNVSNSATASATVDTVSPNSPTAFTAVATGSTIALSWVNPISDFASSTIRRSTSAYPTTISSGTAVGSGLTGTTFSQSSLADATYYYAIFALDAAGNASVAATASATVDTSAPTVADAKISISGASGTGGTFKIGDTVTATWNNTAGGDNNTQTLSAVTVNFTQFGGGAAVSASNSSSTWTATYTIVAGIIDATNRNVAVTARNSVGNGATTTADTTNVSVDNQAPTVAASNISVAGATGSAGAFKVGDTVTAIWNNTAGGDNNTDTLSAVTVNLTQFGGGTAVAATNSAGTWTATYTIIAGFAVSGSRNVVVTVTDNAGNTTTTTDNANATIANSAPVNSVPGAQSLLQTGTLTLSSGGNNRISTTDVDAGGASLQVTLTATHGKLTLSSTSGLSFTSGSGTADTTMIFTGTLANLNAALNGLIYAPIGGYYGSAALQITTNDLGNSGSGGPMTDTDSIALTITALLGYPVILMQPETQLVLLGSGATFAVMANGAPTLTYQWKKDGASISGATGSFYAIPSTAANHAGNYTVVVSNSVGALTSEIALLAFIVAPNEAIITFAVE